MGLVDRAGHRKGVSNGGAGEDGDAHAEGPRVDRWRTAATGVGLEPTIDDLDLVFGRVKRRADGDKGKRHSPKYAPRIVENDPSSHGSCSPAGLALVLG